MSKIFKVFQTLRNHWKKSVFFSGLAIWGANYAYRKHLEFNMMKAYCEEALKYGQEKMSPFDNARHVTVLLNPIANKRKGKADYEKYCAPLFNLAGLKVSLVVTEAEEQTKDLMEIMDNTDCVVVAGGDGTIHEAITGLLRRNDYKQFPIGILPIGKNNFIAYKLNKEIFDPKNDTKAKILAETAMAVVRQTLNKVDVMKIKGERGNPVYSLGDLNMGQLANVSRKVDQYWYLGERMKPYLAYFFQSFKDLTSKWNENKEVSIEYTKPCPGCSKCYQRFDDKQNEEKESLKNQPPKRWWHSFVPKTKSVPIIDPVVEAHKKMIEAMKNTINEECDQWQTLQIKTKNILISNSLNNCLQLTVHPADMSRITFIKEGVRILKKETIPMIEAKDYRIHATNFETNNETINQNKFLETGVNIEKPNSDSSLSLVEEITEHRPNAIKELDDDDNGDGSTQIIVKELDNNVIEKQKNGNNNNNDNHDEEKTEDKNSDEKNEDNTRWISIDNENYEMQTELEIKLQPRSVRIYHGIANVSFVA